jgi:hypothetical protein
MQGATGAINVLFITGFGPIVRDTTQSRKLYSETRLSWCDPELVGCPHEFAGRPGLER